MYFQCLILMIISQIVSGAIITGKRKATFSGPELKQICESIRSDLNGGAKVDQSVNQIVGQFEPKLKSEDGSRLTKFKGLLQTFKSIVDIVENGSLKSLSITKQDDESNESNESSQSTDDNFSTDKPDSDDLVESDDQMSDDNDQGDTVNPNPDSDSDNNNSDHIPDSGNSDENEIDIEFDTDDNDEYNVCELINYPDWIDLDEIEYSEIYGYDYDDDDTYEYDYQFEPFGLRLNLHLSISD